MNINDSNIRPELTFRRLVYLNMQQLTNFPYIEKDFDALTDYELLCLVVKYLNDVIDNSNEQNTSITNLYNAFLELQTYMNNSVQELEDAWNDKTTELETAFNNLQTFVNNYFDNLDVQDEIDNKLDKMLEDGVLEQIIEQFLQSTAIWCFDTVADMKSATNLTNGSNAKTLGYYSLNDGGGSLYHITSSQSQSDYQETLNSGLYATLIIENEMNVHQFGAKGDGTTDDQDSINSALNSGANIINFNKGLTYMVRGYEVGQEQGSSREIRNSQTGIMVQSNTIINLNFSTIKCITNDRTNYNIFTIRDKSNVVIKDGTVIGDVDTHTGTTGEWGHGISIRHSSNVHIINLYLTKCWGDGITTDASDDYTNYCSNIYVEDCICDDNRRQGISIGGIDGFIGVNSKFINTGQTKYTAPGAGVDIEPLETRAHNISFNNCVFNNNKGGGLHANGVNCDNIVIDNCEIKNNEASSTTLNFVDATNCIVKNCYIAWDSTSNKFINVAPGNTILFENNRLKNILFHIASDHFVSYSKVIIKDSQINMTNSSQWNNLIETVSASTVNDFEVIIDNCIIHPDSNLTYTGLVETKFDHGCKTLTVTNSKLYYSTSAIKTTSNLVAKNNTIIQTKSFAIEPQARSSQTSVIQNNVFEHTGYNTVQPGIINTRQNQPAAIIDNIYVIRPMYSEIEITDTYAPSRWGQAYAEDSDKLIQNNYIWNNVIS